MPMKKKGRPANTHTKNEKENITVKFDDVIKFYGYTLTTTRLTANLLCASDAIFYRLRRQRYLKKSFVSEATLHPFSCQIGTRFLINKKNKTQKLKVAQIE